MEKDSRIYVGKKDWGRRGPMYIYQVWCKMRLKKECTMLHELYIVVEHRCVPLPVFQYLLLWLLIGTM